MQEIAAECYEPQKDQDGIPRGLKIGDPAYSGDLRIGRLCDALRYVKNEIRMIETDEKRD